MRTVICVAILGLATGANPTQVQSSKRLIYSASIKNHLGNAKSVFQDVQSALNAENIEVIANPYVPNALATIWPVVIGFDLYNRPVYQYRNVVLYNPGFLTHLELSSGSKWAAISVIAHEIGHHLAGHTLPRNPLEGLKHPWKRELEADFYSGICLARLGATPEDLQRAQRLLFSLWGSESHPDSPRRIREINRGWMEGGGDSITADLEEIWAEIQDDLTKWWY